MDISAKPNYMFSHRFLDFLFNWRWWVAQLVFMPIGIASLVAAYTVFNTSLLTLVLSFVIGALVWTLVEYCLHRYIFHFIGESPFLKHFHYVVHGMHHAFPTNPHRVIFPPFLSIAVGLILLGIMLLLLPLTWVFGSLAGFIMGYSWYEFMHYASHHVKWRISWFRKLKRHHLLHHHSEAFRDKNFGVTTVLWDHVFGTYLV